MSMVGEELGSETPPGSNPDGSTPGSSPTEEAAQREARLRAELREERAKRLGHQYGLSEAVIEHLATVPRDKQEDMAKAISEMRTPGTVTEGGEGETQPDDGDGQPAPPGADAMQANPVNAQPAGAKKVTRAEAVDLQHSNPDLWIRARRNHPRETEMLLRGQDVEGFSIADLVGQA